MKSDTVLFVDDEENILRAIERLFRDKNWTFCSAASPGDALSLLQEKEVAVVVSDNRMPQMSGIDLLCQVRELSPRTVRVLMTAHADLATAVAAINRSEIFRFVCKPWEEKGFDWVVKESLARYRAVRSLVLGDERAMLSLARTVELKDPYTRGHCERVGEYAVAMGRRLGFADSVVKEIRCGGWLHDCGKIGVPEGILNLRGPLTEAQYALIRDHPCWGADVARQAGLSARVIDIILYHHERFDGQGYPMGLQGLDIPQEARMVSVGDVYDSLITDRPYRGCVSRGEAVDILRQFKGSVLDPEMVDLFCDLPPCRI